MKKITTQVDKLNRIVLPSQWLEALGLKSGESVTIRLEGKQMVLESHLQVVSGVQGLFKRFTQSSGKPDSALVADANVNLGEVASGS